MQSRDYGVMFTATGYRFYVYDYQQLKWVRAARRSPARAVHAAAAALRWRSSSTGATCRSMRDFEAQDVENPEPQIMVLSSGEVTPFTIEMEREGMEGRFELSAKLDGELTLAQTGLRLAHAPPTLGRLHAHRGDDRSRDRRARHDGHQQSHQSTTPSRRLTSRKKR